MAFPFVFPGAYSIPQTLTTAAYGWIHSPNPEVNIGSPSVPVAVTYQGNANGTTLNYLQNINHNPLDTGDNLSIPANQSGYLQTWWGFPTWRETLSPFWNDPSSRSTAAPHPTTSPRSAHRPGVHTGQLGTAGRYAVARDDGPVPQHQPAALQRSVRIAQRLLPAEPGVPPPLWSQYSWEDDLVMTGVRSFDIKAYDNSLAAYADLGWGDDPRVTGLLTPQYLGMTTIRQPPTWRATIDAYQWNYVAPAYAYINNAKFNLLTQTFAHEGRVPPLVEDNIFDAQYGAGSYPGYNYTGNIGDDNPAVVRLRRVWDSWSTEYTQAPGTGVNPTSSAAASSRPVRRTRRRSIRRTRRPTRRRCGASRSRSA